MGACLLLILRTLGSGALACGAASEDSASGELSETRGLGALEEISAETRVPVQPALWGSQTGQCITNDEVGEGFAQCWGTSSRLKAGVMLRSPAGEDLCLQTLKGLFGQRSHNDGEKQGFCLSFKAPLCRFELCIKLSKCWRVCQTKSFHEKNLLKLSVLATRG